MANKGLPGTNKLARVIAQRMKQEADMPLVVDFGEIGSGRGLTTNTFSETIPEGDYTVCLHAGDLEPGNRVLVAWVGNEAVVIDKIV